MAAFTIAADGDAYEQRYWPLFLRDRFAAYEAFWLERVVVLTNRMSDLSNVDFQTREELAKQGFTDEDVAIAQLHYTLLRHLGRVFDLLQRAHAFDYRELTAGRPFDQHTFFESFARLSGASDVADELLQRRTTAGTFDPWDERHGSRARRTWRDTNGDPLREIRAYRNRLVHGRVVPELWAQMQTPDGEQLGSVLMYPRIGRVDAFLDWRRVDATTGDALRDFNDAARVALEAWDRVVNYVESAWRAHLLAAT